MSTSSNEVAKILRELELEVYAPALVDEGFETFADLQQISLEDCLAVGMKRGHARRLLGCISERAKTLVAPPQQHDDASRSSITMRLQQASSLKSGSEFADLGGQVKAAAPQLQAPTSLTVEISPPAMRSGVVGTTTLQELNKRNTIPTAPRVVSQPRDVTLLQDKPRSILTCTRLDVSITAILPRAAFVRMEGVWRVECPEDEDARDCIFELPISKDAVVQHVSVHLSETTCDGTSPSPRVNQNRGRLDVRSFGSFTADAEQAKDVAARCPLDCALRRASDQYTFNCGAYHPNVFRCPISDVPRGFVHVEVEYAQSLRFVSRLNRSLSTLTVPLHAVHLQTGCGVVRLSCDVHALAGQSASSPSHAMALVEVPSVPATPSGRPHATRISLVGPIKVKTSPPFVTRCAFDRDFTLEIEHATQIGMPHLGLAKSQPPPYSASGCLLWHLNSIGAGEGATSAVRSAAKMAARASIQSGARRRSLNEADEVPLPMQSPPPHFGAGDYSGSERGGSFALWLKPALQREEGVTYFRRRITFLIDRSFSMSGEPWEHLIDGVMRALNTLERGIDEISIGCIDGSRFGTW